MNPYLSAILAIIFISYLIDMMISILTLTSLNTSLPKEFRDIYNPDDYQKSQQYGRANTYLSILQTSLSTILTVTVILTGTFNTLDIWARAITENNLLVGLLFIGILVLLTFLLSLPFTIYSTFVIDTRYGFNRTSPKTFIFDNLKVLLITALLGGPLLLLILWFFDNTGSIGWLLCWGGVVSFSMVLQYLAPVLILPIFNKFSCLNEGPLKDKILNYTKQQNFNFQGIFIMDGSKRSSKLNAFFTGFGRFKKIVFYDTLINKLQDNEILAVLAHEMGHYKHNHILIATTASILHTGVLFYFLSFFLNNPELTQAFGLQHVSTHSSLVFFGFLFSPINLIVSVFFHVISRSHEFQADKYAAKTLRSSSHLIASLKKLSEANMANLTPHPLVVMLTYSHPPVIERIRRLKHLQLDTRK